MQVLLPNPTGLTETPEGQEGQLGAGVEVGGAGVGVLVGVGGIGVGVRVGVGGMGVGVLVGVGGIGVAVGGTLQQQR